MQFSLQQSKALDAVRQWRRSNELVFYLAGFAGTGKTTLAKYFAEGIEGNVLFGSYTGKAAYVLRQRGCPDATTIHRLIYKSHEKGRLQLLQLQKQLGELCLGVDPAFYHENADIREIERQIREEKEALKRPYFVLNPDSDVREASLVVIDEVSMVDERMGADLLSFGTKVLVLGDPAQLPPVRGEGYFTGKTPDILLTEIHRQAAGNPIIDMATKVRQGEALDYGRYGESEVMDWADIEADHVLKFDQVIVGKNSTRRGANRRIREELKLDGVLPIPTDRLVCLRNDHKEGLLNGAMWRVVEALPLNEDYISLRIESEDEGDPLTVTAHTAHFLEREVAYNERRKAQEFDYGYALTCHKAQGSQWDSVLVFDQSKSFRGHAQRWLYTSITRASKRVTLVR